MRTCEAEPARDEEPTAEPTAEPTLPEPTAEPTAEPALPEAGNAEPGRDAWHPGAQHGACAELGRDAWHEVRALLHGLGLGTQRVEGGRPNCCSCRSRSASDSMLCSR